MARGNAVRAAIYGEKRAPQPTEYEEGQPNKADSNEQISGDATPITNEYHTPCGYLHGESMCQYCIDQGFEQFYSEKEAGEFFDYDTPMLKLSLRTQWMVSRKSHPMKQEF